MGAVAKISRSTLHKLSPERIMSAWFGSGLVYNSGVGTVLPYGKLQAVYWVQNATNKVTCSKPFDYIIRDDR